VVLTRKKKGVLRRSERRKGVFLWKKCVLKLAGNYVKGGGRGISVVFGLQKSVAESRERLHLEETPRGGEGVGAP